MTEKLVFSLPEKKDRKSKFHLILIIILFIIIGLGVANLLLPKTGKLQTDGGNQILSEVKTKELATRLAERSLYDRAAAVWKDYLAKANLSDTDKAKVLFQVGILLEKAGSYAEAIEFFYRSEAVAKLDELQKDIGTHVKSCFEKLGKFTALRYELMSRTDLDKQSKTESDVVAEIGPEKITETQLDSMIEGWVDNQLSSAAMYMSPQQLGEQKKKALEHYKTPSAKQEYLQMWVANQVLYRKALDEGLSEKAEIKKVIDELAKSVLSQQVLNKEVAAKLSVTQTDVENYYGANKDKFKTPAGARISHIVVENEQQAKDLIKQLKESSDSNSFANFAKQYSKDDGTKETGGRIESDIEPGSFVAVVGELPELNKKIFASEQPTILDEPFKGQKGWEIVRVDSKQSERQKELSEVKDEVERQLVTQKRQDIQNSFIKQLMDEYKVIVHIKPAGADEGQKDLQPLAGENK